MSGKNDPMYGKFEHPIKMIIEAESNAQEKNKGIVDVLFNVEKSNRYAETLIGESDFDTFQSAKEGQGAENDSVEMTFKKTIEHIAFMKEFTITKEMADDAKSGISADIKSKPKKFVRAYYKTRNKLAAWALINGTSTTGIFNKATVDLSTADGLALFSTSHKYAKAELKGKTQSNYFYGDIASDSSKLEEALGVLSNKLRNFKDENGEVMEYVADIVIVPCNRPKLEAMVKKVVGSERTVGSNNNDINTQYGNWTVVVLPGWETNDDRIMVMSSEANENLYGNMFYNRVPLDIRSNIDDHTRNYYWNGYCRFGIGFNTWKHIALAVHNTGTMSGATKLD
jgi:hypothetical protein